MHKSEPDTAPAARLVRIAAALRTGATPDPSDAGAFADGVDRWLKGGGPLDGYLGLGGEIGRDTPRTRFRRSERNRHLRDAWEVVDPSASPWGRSVRLADEIRRFESIVWPRWRDLDEPPSGCSKLRRALFYARKLGALPATPRGVELAIGNCPVPSDE